MYYIFFIIIMLFCQPLYCRRLKTGPLFGLAQNIPGKGLISPLFEVSYFDSIHKPLCLISNQVLYGLTDRFSVNVGFPFVKTRDNTIKSFGLGNVFLQGEFAFLQTHDDDFDHQMTVFGTVFAPSATTTIQTFVSNKSTNYLFGITHNLYSSSWYLYTESGYWIMTRQKNGIKLGNIFLYNLGVGRAIFDLMDTYNFLIVYFDMSAAFSQRLKDPTDALAENFPESIIFFGPSVRYDIGHWSIKAGFQYPILNKGNKGRIDEEKFDCRIAFSIRYFV